MYNLTNLLSDGGSKALPIVIVIVLILFMIPIKHQFCNFFTIKISLFNSCFCKIYWGRNKMEGKYDVLSVYPPRSERLSTVPNFPKNRRSEASAGFHAKTISGRAARSSILFAAFCRSKKKLIVFLL